MTRDDIIRMAREAGIRLSKDVWPWEGEAEEALERFAALVADTERKHCYDLLDTLIKAEREMCARVCDGDGVRQSTGDECAAAIRARGEK